MGFYCHGLYYTGIFTNVKHKIGNILERGPPEAEKGDDVPQTSESKVVQEATLE